MRPINVYKAERDIPGLADKIAKARSIAYLSLCQRAPEVCSDTIKRKSADLLKTVAAAQDQPDLFYLHSVLASCGWNGNNDIFAADEIWAARKSAEDKKINYNHDEKDIVGHITACYATDASYDILDDTSSVDDLPEQFHIVTAGVLYTAWEDDGLVKRMNEILGQIAKGSIFVSMEALFDNFDYGIIEENGDEYVVERNKDTAFLSKFLTAYGGDGVYKNAKVGRLLRNITFSGKGLVYKPANPESIIFNNTIPFKAVANKLITEEVQTMSNDALKVEPSKVSGPDLSDMTVKIDSLTKAMEVLVEDRKQAQVKAEADAKAAIDSEIKNLKASLVEKDSKIEQLTKELESAKAANKNEDLEKQLVEANKAAKAAQDELAKIAKEQKASARLAKLTEVGKTNDEAQEMLSKGGFGVLDDGTFDVMVSELKKLTKASNNTDESEDEDDAFDGVKVTKAEVSKAGAGSGDAKTKFQNLSALFSKSLKTTAGKAVGQKS